MLSLFLSLSILVGWVVFLQLGSCFVPSCCFLILQFHILYALIQVGVCSFTCFFADLLYKVRFFMFDYLNKLNSNGLTDAGAPSPLSTPLKFCSYNGTACCNSTEDSQIQKQFQSMNISSSACASLLKPVLCAVSPCLRLIIA